MKEIYLLSGLGADKRVFDFIDLSGYKLHHVVWMEPLDSEPIENYAKRLLSQIPSIRPTLIGVSFGGMMAVEIGKLIETEKIILISSAKTKFEVPIYLRFMGRLGLNKLMPARLLKQVNAFSFWYFGTKTKKENDLLKAIFKDINDKFLKWAMDKIANWKNTSRLNNIIHIHGTKDKVLPLKTADFIINDGEHLMILSRGEELTRVIRKVLG